MRPAGAILAYTVHIQCGWFEVTYNHFRRLLGPQRGLQWGQHRELVMLLTICVKLGLCFFAMSFSKKSRHSVKRSPRAVSVCQSAALTVKGGVARAYA